MHNHEFHFNSKLLFHYFLKTVQNNHRPNNFRDPQTRKYWDNTT